MILNSSRIQNEFFSLRKSRYNQLLWQQICLFGKDETAYYEFYFRKLSAWDLSFRFCIRYRRHFWETIIYLFSIFPSQFRNTEHRWSFFYWMAYTEKYLDLLYWIIKYWDIWTCCDRISWIIVSKNVCTGKIFNKFKDVFDYYFFNFMILMIPCFNEISYFWAVTY